MWLINALEIYTPFDTDRRLADLVSQLAGDFSCSRSVLVCDGSFFHGGHFVLLSHGKRDVVAWVNGRSVVYLCRSVCGHCLL